MQRVKYIIPCERRHPVACKAAKGAKHGGPGRLVAGPALMAIAVANDADAISLSKGIIGEPFKRTPAGVDLDRPFEGMVVRIGDVGVATTALRPHNRVLVRAEGIEEFSRVPAIRLETRAVGDQGMGGAI